ncbi:TOMM precursor leader peptide-binding protein [Streptomyces sp. NPDC001714]|uniref:TOMM precursor leader peptide-binding protein n=1 Tax=Streptomyces sp. NPDC001714 TaxID=3364603 RepID=UPI0036B27A4D
MATAVRVTGSPVSPVHLSRGPFGEAVVERINSRFPGRQLDTVSRLRREITETDVDFIVVALWRVSRSLCAEVDDIAYATGVPWILIAQEEGTIKVGPQVTPGSQAACWHCYYSRRVQHDRTWPTTHALHSAYEQDDDIGPGGLLPHHVRIAAAVACQSITRHNVDTGSTGVVTIDQTTTHLRSDPVTGCHGCPRCHAPTLSATPDTVEATGRSHG